MTRSFWTAFVVLLVALDQITKWLVESYLPFQRTVGFLPYLSWYRTHNEGVAFSMLSSLSDTALIFMTFVIIGFVLWLWYSHNSARQLSSFGFALVLSGAIGNVIDRIWFGKVIDFIFFHIDAIGFRFAIFNLADTFITIGAGAIILDEILVWRRNRVVKRNG